MSMLQKILPVVISLFLSTALPACPETGYRLWLRYDKISDPVLLQNYKSSITGYVFVGNSPTITVTRNELKIALKGLLDCEIPELASPEKIKKKSFILAGTPSDSKLIASLIPLHGLAKIGNEGFIIKTVRFHKANIII
ncbi:MAG TPA: alpha-glucuronidase family glycosyl hydrolase, partial [Bacteroidales bacterium]|nr:alpha-glucuronidase family glycosyl hydrolase [Bacteroidales bacterium]